MILRPPTENEICAQPSSSPPNVLIGGPVRNSPGFPLKACGNDGSGTTRINATSLFEGARAGPGAAGAATKFRNMSRKDAKAAKFGVCNESRSKGYHLFSLNLATLRLSGRNFRIRVSSAVESFAQAAQILNYSNTKGFLLRAKSRCFADAHHDVCGVKCDFIHCGRA
jgi:hypothetical protein